MRRKALPLSLSLSASGSKLHSVAAAAGPLENPLLPPNWSGQEGRKTSPQKLSIRESLASPSWHTYTHTTAPLYLYLSLPPPPVSHCEECARKHRTGTRPSTAPRRFMCRKSDAALRRGIHRAGPALRRDWIIQCAARRRRPPAFSLLLLLLLSKSPP